MKELFGYLPINQCIDIDIAKIRPTKDCAEYQDKFLRDFNNDGFFYPPIIYTATLDREGNATSCEMNSLKPAKVFPLANSHELEIEKPISEENFRKQDGGFIVHLLAFIFGTRLQFQGWKFDTRISKIGSCTWRADIADNILLLDSAYKTWRSWNQDSRFRMVNILYLISRTRCLEWEWDRLLYESIIFDGLFGLHQQITKKDQTAKKKNYFKIVCDTYGLRHNDKSKIFVDIRNDWVHEGIWADGMIGSRVDQNAYNYWRFFDKFNSRFLIALLDFPCEYISSPWHCMGAQVLRPTSQSR